MQVFVKFKIISYLCASFFERKGGGCPLFYWYMADLTNTLKGYAEEFLTDGEHFLVAIEKTGKAGQKYSLIIDGDHGASIDYCAALSRHVSRRVDEELGDDSTTPFTFDVASPGVDRPLLMERQYPKHIGREIKFGTPEGPVKGKLLAVENGQITVNAEIVEKEKKKPRYEERTYKIELIKEPKIIVSFK